MIVTVEELSQTSLYPEVIAAITRNNPEAAAMQILAAESLCKTYLTKYDLKAAFGDEDTPPTVTSPALKKIVKMIIHEELDGVVRLVSVSGVAL